jgi:hypothetical protein
VAGALCVDGELLCAWLRSACMSGATCVGYCTPASSAPLETARIALVKRIGCAGLGSHKDTLGDNKNGIAYKEFS